MFATGHNYSLESFGRKMECGWSAKPQRDKPQAGGLLGFQVAERDVGVAVAGVEDTAPVAAAAAGAAAGFGRTLAFDAAGGVGQGVEASQRDSLVTDFAFAIIASFDTHERPLDVGQFAAFDFGQLRADLVLGGIERLVDDVAAGLLAQLAEQAQVAWSALRSALRRVTSSSRILLIDSLRLIVFHLAWRATTDARPNGHVRRLA